MCQHPIPPCTDIYDPVCGSDQRTYPNQCRFVQRFAQNSYDMGETRTAFSMCNSSTGLQMLYKGPCCRDECSDEPSPVCDSENRTHLNLCKFGHQRCLGYRVHNKNITVHSYSACPEDSCDIHCPQLYQPVCSKTGKTFVNECELKKLNCFMQLHNSTTKLIEIDYPRGSHTKKFEDI